MRVLGKDFKEGRYRAPSTSKSPKRSKKAREAKGALGQSHEARPLRPCPPQVPRWWPCRITMATPLPPRSRR